MAGSNGRSSAGSAPPTYERRPSRTVGSRSPWPDHRLGGENGGGGAAGAAGQPIHHGAPCCVGNAGGEPEGDEPVRGGGAAGQVIHYGVPYRDGRKWWWPLPEREETSWRESLAPGGQVRPSWPNGR